MPLTSAFRGFGDTRPDVVVLVRRVVVVAIGRVQVVVVVVERPAADTTQIELQAHTELRHMLSEDATGRGGLAGERTCRAQAAD